MHVHKIKKIGVVVRVFLKLHYIIHRPASCLFGEERCGGVLVWFWFGFLCVWLFYFFLLPQGLKKTSEDGRGQHLFHSPGP